MKSETSWRTTKAVKTNWNVGEEYATQQIIWVKWKVRHTKQTEEIMVY